MAVKNACPACRNLGCLHADARLIHTDTCTSPPAIAGAATYLLFNRTQHPGVEASHGLRKDALAEERDGMEAEGHNIKESSGRKLTRYDIQATLCLHNAASSMLHTAEDLQQT